MSNSIALSTNRKVKVTKKIGDVSEISSQIFVLEYLDTINDVNDNQKVKLTLSSERNSKLLDESNYVMAGTRVDSIKDEKDWLVVSFGGLMGRFKVKDNVNTTRWWVYVKF